MLEIGKMAVSSEREALGKMIILVGEQVLSQAGTEMKGTGMITDETMNKLYFIFGPPLYQALDLLDKGDIVCIINPTGKRVYQVNASSGSNQYLCLESVHYCSCPYFLYSVLVRNEALMCKHLLSVKLACAMETLGQPKLVSEAEFTSITSTT